LGLVGSNEPSLSFVQWNQESGFTVDNDFLDSATALATTAVSHAIASRLMMPNGS